MDYFISAEQKAYCDWQLDLLLLSFKNNNLPNQPLVALAETNEPRYEKLHLLNKHDQVFSHQNLGQKRGFAGLNELYTLSWALDNNKIKMPLCVLKPHFILKYANFNPFRVEGSPSFVFAIDPFFTFDVVEKNVGDFAKDMTNSKAVYREKWLPLGDVFFINNLPISLVRRTAQIAEFLILNQILQKKTVWENTIKLAWIINMIDVADQVHIHGNYDFTSTMIDSQDTPFIDYTHGMPPVFNKNMFLYPPPSYMSFGDPIETISNCYNTKNSHYMSELANELLSKRESNI